jgi:hypothetical protein
MSNLLAEARAARPSGPAGFANIKWMIVSRSDWARLGESSARANCRQ